MEASLNPSRRKGISIMRLTTRTIQNTEAESFINKRDRIKSRRGAFLWLPVYCSNDVVHGSW